MDTERINIEPEYEIVKKSEPEKLASTAGEHLYHLKFGLEHAIEGEEESLINLFLDSYFREYNRTLKKEINPEDPKVYIFSFTREDLIDFKRDTQELIKILEENNKKKQMSRYADHLEKLKKILSETDQKLEKLEDGKKDGRRKAA
jgi:hemerythrin-like domain-containing protein